MSKGGYAAELAKLLNVSTRSVGKACELGRITFVNRNGKRWFNDLQASAREYLAARDGGRGSHSANMALADTGDGEIVPALADDEKIESYARSAARLQHYKASLAEIDYQIQMGTLVRKDEYDREIFKFHRTIRDRILNVPDRLAAVLAGEDDQGRIHTILSRELRQVLSELADEAERLG